MGSVCRGQNDDGDDGLFVVVVVVAVVVVAVVVVAVVCCCCGCGCLLFPTTKWKGKRDNNTFCSSQRRAMTTKGGEVEGDGPPSEERKREGDGRRGEEGGESRRDVNNKRKCERRHSAFVPRPLRFAKKMLLDFFFNQTSDEDCWHFVFSFRFVTTDAKNSEKPEAKLKKKKRFAVDNDDILEFLGGIVGKRKAIIIIVIIVIIVIVVIVIIVIIVIVVIVIIVIIVIVVLIIIVIIVFVIIVIVVLIIIVIIVIVIIVIIIIVIIVIIVIVVLIIAVVVVLGIDSLLQQCIAIIVFVIIFDVLEK